MGNLTFNGISSEDLGIRIASPPSYSCPQKNRSSTQLLGRDGDIIIDYGTYNNVSRSYVMSLPIDEGEYTYYASKISGWLNGPSGYSRLEDSYEPEYYRMAIMTKELTFTNVNDSAIAFEVEFECKPQRFFKYGENYVLLCSASKAENSYSFTINNKLKNPTSFSAKPLYRITTSNEQKPYSIKIRHTKKNGLYYDAVLKISNNNSSERRYIYFDNDSYSCYEVKYIDGVKTIINLNANVDFASYIEFGDGCIGGDEQINIIEIDNIEKVEVMPRWWTL